MTDLLGTVAANLGTLITKPSVDEITKAAPLRTQVREAVLKRYDLFQKESPIYTEAGLTYWQTRPMKTFLESEVAWWNANIELTVQQVTTRKTSYIETLAALNKDIENYLKVSIAALPADKSANVLLKLKNALGNSSSIANKEGFNDISPTAPAPAAEAESSSAAPAPAPAPASIFDLNGIYSTINISSIQSSITNSQTAAAAAAAEVPPSPERTWNDDISSAAKHAFKWAGILLYIIVALRFASFAANDLLYKPLPYRALAFVYTFLFMPVLFPYYLYREYIHWLWPDVDAPHFESIFPVVPYESSSESSIDQKIYGYANTPKINIWMDKLRQQQTQNRMSVLQSTVLADLIAAKEES